jgi:hypothetical protein
MAARRVWDAEVAGSSPAGPTREPPRSVVGAVDGEAGHTDPRDDPSGCVRDSIRMAQHAAATRDVAQMAERPAGGREAARSTRAVSTTMKASVVTPRRHGRAARQRAATPPSPVQLRVPSPTQKRRADLMIRRRCFHLASGRLEGRTHPGWACNRTWSSWPSRREARRDRWRPATGPANDREGTPGRLRHHARSHRLMAGRGAFTAEARVQFPLGVRFAGGPVTSRVS